jgi:hypothetical protein
MGIKKNLHPNLIALAYNILIDFNLLDIFKLYGLFCILWKVCVY